MSVYYYLPFANEVVSAQEIELRVSVTDVPRTWDTAVSYKEQYLQDNHAIMIEGESEDFYSVRHKYVLTESQIADQFCELLNDDYPTYVVMGQTFEAGQVLKHNDPRAFRSFVLDHIDALIRDGSLIELP